MLHGLLNGLPDGLWRPDGLLRGLLRGLSLPDATAGAALTPIGQHADTVAEVGRIVKLDRVSDQGGRIASMGQESIFLCRGEGRGKCQRYQVSRRAEALRLAREMSQHEAVEVWEGYLAPRRLIASLGPESQFGRRRTGLPRKLHYGEVICDDRGMTYALATSEPLLLRALAADKRHIEHDGRYRYCKVRWGPEQPSDIDGLARGYAPGTAKRARRALKSHGVYYFKCFGGPKHCDFPSGRDE